MQFRPRLTGASGSPWVATTRPFWEPTSTEQPVPQKRHGALSQVMAVLSVLVIRFAARVGALTPATAAAAATALAFIKSRRLSFMAYPHFAYRVSCRVYRSGSRSGGEQHTRHRFYR